MRSARIFCLRVPSHGNAVMWPGPDWTWIPDVLDVFTKSQILQDILWTDSWPKSTRWIGPFRLDYSSWDCFPAWPQENTLKDTWKLWRYAWLDHEIMSPFCIISRLSVAQAQGPRPKPPVLTGSTWQPTGRKMLACLIRYWVKVSKNGFWNMW